MSKFVFTLVACGLLISACSQSRMKAIDVAETVISDENKGVKTLPIPGVNTASQEHDITGYALNDNTKMNEDTKKFAESLKGIYVQTQKNVELGQVFLLQLDSKNGMVYKFKGQVTAEGEYKSLSQETLGQLDSENIETIEVKQMKCLDACKNLEISLEVEKGEGIVPVTIKALIEGRNLDDKDEIGVKAIEGEINEKLHIALTNVNRVERVAAYVAGSDSSTVTYSLKKNLDVLILSAGVKNRGTSQTPEFLYMNSDYLNDDKLKFETVSLDSSEGEVQTLILKHSADAGVTVKLGFRSPLAARPFTASGK